MRRARSLKGVFPFSFGVTSYLYPATIIHNVRRLRRVADEMELILFEGRDYSNLPTPKDIGKILSLAQPAGMRFNVHLPMDIDVVSADDQVRRQSLETVSRIVDLTAPLNPTSYTLHILKDEKAARNAWKSRVEEALASIPGPHRRFAVETLSWDLREIAPLIEAQDYSVCIDIGHLLMGGYDVPEMFRHFTGRVEMIHLHGVKDRTDHVSLSHLGAEVKTMIASTITALGFTRSLCLEVFRLSDFVTSQESLREMFAPHGQTGGPQC